MADKITGWRHIGDKNYMSKKKRFIWLILLTLFAPAVWAEDPPDDAGLLRMFKGKREIMELAKPFLKNPGDASSASRAVSPQKFSVSSSTAASKDIPRVAGAESVFKLGEVYCYPNPAKRADPTFHMETGLADRVELKIYDTSGDLVHETVLPGPPQIIDDGQGPQYAYEYRWDIRNAGSGVYVFNMTARKGDKTLKKTGRCAVIK